MIEKRSQNLDGELKQLRRENQFLLSKLQEYKRAIQANTDLKTLQEVAQDLLELRQAQEELKKERDYFKNVLDNSADAIGIVDANGRFMRWNKRAEELFGYSFKELKGKSAFDLYADKGELSTLLEQLRRNGYVRDYEVSIRRKDGQSFPFGMSISVLKDKGRTIGSVCVARELSQIKEVQRVLQQANEELEKRVLERTAELTAANKKLEEANIALRVLLEKKDEHKKVYEQNMVFNVKNLLQPCIDRLKEMSPDKQQFVFLQMMEDYLAHIISPLQRDLSHRFGLTPTELQLIELIKSGKQTKEIADFLNLSKRTIDTHRHNIRKKLGIANKQINLRAYLLLLEQNINQD